MKKVLSILHKVVTVVLLILPLVLIGYVMTFHLSGEVPSLFGYSTSIVVTPSMSDVLPVGSVILNKNYHEGEPLEVGQIITYLGEEGSFEGKLVTHKIESITVAEDGSTVIFTKGTQNTALDPAITPANVKSVLVRRLFNFGKAYQWIRNPAGFFLVLVVPILLIVAYEIWSFQRTLRKEKESEANEEPENQNESQ